MDERYTKTSTKRVLVFSAAESQTNETLNTSRHVQRAMDRLRNSRPESSFTMRQLEKKFAKKH